MFITKKKHDAAIEHLNDKIATLNDDLRAEQNTVGHMIQRNRELQTQLLAARAEAEANKADAEKYRRSRANLALGTAASAAKRKAAANG